MKSAAACLRPPPARRWKFPSPLFSSDRLEGFNRLTLLSLYNIFQLTF